MYSADLSHHRHSWDDWTCLVANCLRRSHSDGNFMQFPYLQEVVRPIVITQIPTMFRFNPVDPCRYASLGSAWAKFDGPLVQLGMKRDPFLCDPMRMCFDTSREIKI